MATLTGALLLVMLLALAGLAPAAVPDVGGKRDFSLMTQNCYVGGYVDRLLTVDPSDLQKLVEAVTLTYAEVLASRPDLRMAGIADQIAARRPDVVALQEVSLLRVQSPGDLITGGQTPATTVVFDYLQLVLHALAARGAHYAAAVVSTEIDAEMPMLNLTTGGIDDARLTDREVILVRTDLPPGYLRVSNPQHGQFANIIVIPSTGLRVPRGWCSVDVFVRGRTFRCINTHLEDETQPGLQWLQARELLAGPARVSGPVIVTGDLNTDANHRNGTFSYDTLLAAGFTDPWNLLHRGAPGLTWGHDPDLADPHLAFVWRIDLVLTRGGHFVPAQMTVLDQSLGRSQPPLWPSDHAGVFACFLVR